MPDHHAGGEAGDENGAHPPPDVGSPLSRPDRSVTDSLYNLLADERRRQLLSFLSDRASESVPVERLVDHVTENEQPGPEPTTHWEGVAIDLHHVHLPMLADAGVIDHNPAEGVVWYTGPDAIDTLLSVAAEVERERG